MAQATPTRFTQKKSLGQVFLKVDWPVERMSARLKDLGIRRVLEIGPGPGNLTQGLLKAGMAVTAVEKDVRFATHLAEQASHFHATPGASLDVVNTDILRYDFGSWLAEDPAPSAVVGNIPYNISSPLLIKALSHLPELKAIMFMTQLEFARRVEAKAGGKDFGSLSVYAQLRSDISFEFEVERSLFKPVPKVDSGVFLVTPRADTFAQPILKTTEQLCRAAFSQRRKKLRNSIRPFLEKKADPEACPIDLERRADSISPEEYVTLARWVLAEE